MVNDRSIEYRSPGTFSRTGIQPTYDVATKFKNCNGSCYTTSAARINKGYMDLYGVAPIDFTRNEDGIFTSDDYKTTSTQSGSLNYGYGAGGALINGGEGEAINNEGVWGGQLKSGAALQIWHSTNTENIVENGGHSQMFLKYNYDESGNVKSLDIFDNSGKVETLNKTRYLGLETIYGTNLLDIK